LRLPLFEQNKALLERIAELEGRGGGKPPKTPADYRRIGWEVFSRAGEGLLLVA
jgi:hypothetical protein